GWSFVLLCFVFWLWCCCLCVFFFFFFQAEDGIRDRTVTGVQTCALRSDLRDEVRFILLEGGDRIMPEIDPKLADYGTGVLRARRGADIRTGARVQAIEPGKLHLAGETIEAETIVLAAGIIPSPVVAELPVEKDRHGHIVVDGTLRCPSHPEVWALGDCAAIPAPDGRPYPSLAQHALREARVL